MCHPAVKKLFVALFALLMVSSAEASIYGVIAPTFLLAPGDQNGPNNLPSSLTVNGTQCTLAIDYDARDISGTSWPARVGDSLTEAGAGSSPTSGRAPFSEASARSAEYAVAGGKYHEAAASSTGDVTTEDLVWEVIVKVGTSAATAYGVMSHFDAATAGWQVATDNSPASFTLFWKTSAAALRSAKATPTYDPAAWYHVMWSKDNSESTVSQCVTINVNGQASSLSVNPGSCDAGVSLAASVPKLTIGAASGGTSKLTGGGVVVARMWKCAAALPGGASNATVMNAIAAERFARVTGTYAKMAGGQAYPATSSRASQAYTRIDRDSDGIQHHFITGAHWPRISMVKEAGSSTRVTGYLPEASVANIMLQSSALNSATFTKGGVTATADATAAPDGLTTADRLVATSGAGVSSHRALQSSSSLTASTTYVTSCYVKADTGNFTWGICGNASLGQMAWIRLSDCAAGSGAFTAESVGNGWCRVSIRYGSGGGGSTAMGVQFSNADGVENYDDGTTLSSAYAWCLQTEVGQFPTSCIQTGAGSVTRSADDLRYTITGNAKTSGTMSATFLVTSHDYSLSAGYCLANLHQASNQYNALFLVSANDGCDGETSNTTLQAQVQGTTDVIDGNRHSCRWSFNTNDFQGWTDATSNGVDTGGTLPTPTTLFVGNFSGGNNNPGGILQRVEIWGGDIVP